MNITINTRSIDAAERAAIAATPGGTVAWSTDAGPGLYVVIVYASRDDLDADELGESGLALARYTVTVETLDEE